MKTGERVKELRKQMGLTQAELGVVLGLGQKSTSMIEQGVTTLNQNQLKTLSDLFNVSIDYLVTGKEKTFSNDDFELLKMIHADTSLYQSLISMVNAKKQVNSRLCA